MASSSVELGPECDSAAKAQQHMYEQITDPSSPHRGRLILKKRKHRKIISVKEEGKLVAGSRLWPDTRTDWPTDHRS
jgi:hypothetical protein